MSGFLDFISNYKSDVARCVAAIGAEQLRSLVYDIKRADRVWLIGNGGSASLASHMATDLQLAGKAALALTDVAAITTYANDVGYTFSFVNQLKRLVHHRLSDLLIAISGSGNSPNIVEACRWARAAGMHVVGIFGFDGGEAPVDRRIHIDEHRMGVVQDVQQVILHMVCYWLIQEREGRV